MDTLVRYRVHGANTSQLWRSLPAPPPPRAGLASRLVGYDVDPAELNQLTAALYDDAPLDAVIGHRLVRYLDDLFAALVESDLVVEPLDAVRALRDGQRARIEAAVLGVRLARTEADMSGDRSGDDAVATFMKDRRSGHKPLL